MKLSIRDAKSKKSKAFSESNPQADSDKSIMKKFENLKATPTIISRDLSIEGEIKSAGVIEIEGSIKGNLTGNNVVIRETGAVTGEIIAESVSIRGHFDGKIRSKTIDVAKKAKVCGEIQYHTLSVEDGACIDGQFKRIGNKVDMPQNDDVKQG